MGNRFSLGKYYRTTWFRLFCFFMVTSVFSTINFIFPWMYKFIYDEYIPTGSMQLFRSIALVIALLTVGKSIFNLLQASLSMGIQLKIREKLRLDLLWRVMHYRYIFFQEKSSGDIINKLIPEIDIVAGVMLNICKTVIFILQILAFFVIFFYIEWPLALMFLAIILISIIWTLLLKKKIIAFGAKALSLRENYYSFFYNLVHSIKEIKLYSIFNFQKEILNQLSIKNRQLAAQQNIYNTALEIISNLPIYLGNILVIVYSFYKMRSGDYSFGMVITILVFTGFIVSPIIELSNAFSIIQNGWESLLKMKKDFEYPTEPQTEFILPEVKRQIALQDLAFAYTDDTPVLKDINIEFNPNCFVTIVGESGSGKSTLINLILKLYDYRYGVITIDEALLPDIKTNNVRQIIGVVSQDSFILADTLKNNIDLNSQLTDESVRELTSLVELDDLVKKLPEGIHTPLAERGRNLSGGEKQRILLARCLAKGVNVLILDEATSALDLHTEKKIIETLLNIRAERKNFFIIAIAHRPSFTQYSDLICLLENGQIAEQGTHNQLMTAGGKYHSLFSTRGNDNGEI